MPRSALFWFAAFGLAAGLIIFCLDFLITTEREELEARLDQAIQAYLAGNVDGAMAIVASDYEHEGETFEQLRERAQRAWQQFQPEEITVQRLDLDLEDDTATSEMTLIVRVSHEMGYSGPGQVKACIQWERRQEQWWIVSAEVGQ